MEGVPFSLGRIKQTTKRPVLLELRWGVIETLIRPSWESAHRVVMFRKPRTFSLFLSL